MEDEMVGWPHQLSGHEFEQTPGDSEGQISLACCSPWGHKRVGRDLVTKQQQQMYVQYRTYKKTESKNNETRQIPTHK